MAPSVGVVTENARAKTLNIVSTMISKSDFTSFLLVFFMCYNRYRYSGVCTSFPAQENYGEFIESIICLSGSERVFSVQHDAYLYFSLSPCSGLKSMHL
jgi:hypothetical protein